jgi:hypothetical protein
VYVTAPAALCGCSACHLQVFVLGAVKPVCTLLSNIAHHNHPTALLAREPVHLLYGVALKPAMLCQKMAVLSENLRSAETGGLC